MTFFLVLSFYLLFLLLLNNFCLLPTFHIPPLPLTPLPLPFPLQWNFTRKWVTMKLIHEKARGLWIQLFLLLKNLKCNLYSCNSRSTLLFPVVYVFPQSCAAISTITPPPHHCKHFHCWRNPVWNHPSCLWHPLV